MDFRLYIRSLHKKEREELAKFLGTTTLYINKIAYTDQRPSLERAYRMEVFSGGKTTRQEIYPEHLGDLVNPKAAEGRELFPEFDVSCRVKGPAEDAPTDANLKVHCAGAAVYIDLPGGETVAMSAEEAAVLSEALQRGIVGHLIGRTAVRRMMDEFDGEADLKRAS